MNKENEKLEVIKKRCKVTATAVKVIEIVLIVLAVLILAFSIACFVMKDSVNSAAATGSGMGYTLDFSEFSFGDGGMFSFRFDPAKYAEAGDYGTASGIVLLLASWICIITIVVAAIFRRMFTSIIESESPFSEDVLKKMKIAFVIISLSIVCFISIVWGLVAAGLFWCLVAIFEYGVEIQKQVDETL